LLAASLPSCQRSVEEAPTFELATQRASSNALVMDMGSDDVGAFAKSGFFAPESVGARRASWSNGPVSKLNFDLTPSDTPYTVSWLAEPLPAIAPVAAKLAVNGHPVWDAELSGGWQGYAVRLERGTLRTDNNELVLKYDKTARPADMDPSSPDSRDLAASFDQISVQPITDRVRLRFNPRNALTRASLGEGWAVDAADIAPGIWTVGQRAEVRLALWQPAGRAFTLELTAHGQAAIAVQSVSVAWNETVLGDLAFTPKRSTQRLRVPGELVREQNTLTLSPRDPRAPATLDAGSRDLRSLGARVLKLELFPAP
jgi:hypothetical protein